MPVPARFRAELDAAVSGSAGLAAANRLCVASASLDGVDGAAVSLIYDGITSGTFGASGELSKRLDEFQFTFGEGPCLDAVRAGSSVLVPDLEDPGEHRWPAFRGAAVEAGVSGLFALPVILASCPIGALDLFSLTPGALSPETMSCGLLAAELAALPLLDLMTADVDWPSITEGESSWDQLASLERVEVYQATGMIMGAFDITSVEALARLRAYAFTHGKTATDVAWAIVERDLPLDEDWLGDPRRTP